MEPSNRTKTTRDGECPSHEKGVVGQSTGVNLQKAKRLLLLTLSRELAKPAQAPYRILRTNQTEDVIVYQVIVDSSIELHYFIRFLIDRLILHHELVNNKVFSTNEIFSALQSTLETQEDNMEAISFERDANRGVHCCDISFHDFSKFLLGN